MIIGVAPWGLDDEPQPAKLEDYGPRPAAPPEDAPSTAELIRRAMARFPHVRAALARAESEAPASMNESGE